MTARHALRQRREQQGLTQETAAFRLDVAVSTYQSWERGLKTPRVGFRPRLAKLFQVSLAEVDAYLDGNGATTLNGHTVPAWLGHLASLEQAAAHLWAFETTTVQGLLQTADYAFAIERADAVAKSEEGIARRVQTRMARQSVLTREPDPLTLALVLDEAILHRVAGNAEIMAAQLDHLADMAEQPNIDLQVLPLDAGVFVFGSFTLLASPDSEGPFMAITEDRAGPQYHDRPHEIEVHASLFEYLSDVALPSAESIDLLRSVSKEKYQ